MTLDELNQININDTGQIKALQTFLKSRGYYSGGIDGKWGGGTVDGVKSLRGDLQTEAQTKAETARAGAETARTNLEAEQEKSSWGRFGQEFGPYGAGASGGLLAGYGIARANKAADTGLAGEVGRMPSNKSITPVVAEQTMDARLRGRTMRAGKQLLNPAAAFGLAEVTRRYVKPSVSEEIQPYVDLAASAEQGLGGGMAVMTIKDALSSKNPVSAETEALIRSRAAEARGDPYTVSSRDKTAPPQQGPDPARMAELRAMRAADLKVQAKAAGLHVSGTKEDLARRIAESQASSPAAKPKGRMPRGKAGLLAPLVAGSMAYDAASGEAEAAGAEPMEARGRGLLAGAGAAGATAAVPYAISKLPEAMGTAARAAGAGVTPSTVDAMTDYSPDDLAQGRNMLARNLPSALRGGAVEDAYQMAQVPERNPARAGGGQDFDAMLAEFVRSIEEHNAGVGEQADSPF